MLVAAGGARRRGGPLEGRPLKRRDCRRQAGPWAVGRSGVTSDPAAGRWRQAGSGGPVAASTAAGDCGGRRLRAGPAGAGRWRRAGGIGLVQRASRFAPGRRPPARRSCSGLADDSNPGSSSIITAGAAISIAVTVAGSWQRPGDPAASRRTTRTRQRLGTTRPLRSPPPGRHQ